MGKISIEFYNREINAVVEDDITCDEVVKLISSLLYSHGYSLYNIVEALNEASDDICQSNKLFNKDKL